MFKAFLFFIAGFLCFLEPTDVLASCVKPRRIRINSDMDLGKDFENKIVQRYSRSCLVMDDLNNLTKAIAGAYAAQGYVTAKAEIPEQDTSNGELIINVKGGKFQNIEYENADSLYLKSEFSKIEGKAVNLKRVEKALENTNLLRSNNVHIKIVPGDKEYESKLVVKNDRSKPIRFNAGIESISSDNKARIFGTAGVSIDNLFSISDILILNERLNISNSDESTSRNYSLFWSAPSGYYRYIVNYDYGFHKDVVDASGQKIIYAGKNYRGSFGVTKTLIDSKEKRLDLNTRIRKVRYIEKFDNFTLDYQSYKLTVAEVGLTLHNRFKNSLLTFAFDIEDGLRHDSSGISDIQAHPRSDFVKFKFTSSLMQNIYKNEINNNLLYLTSILKFQHSNNVLYGGEKFDVSGNDAVRGSYGANLKGERGFVSHNDINYEVRSLNQWSNLFNKIQFFAGCDFGGYRNNTDNDKISTVSSASVGIKTSSNHVSTNITFSKLLSNFTPYRMSRRHSVFLSINLEI